MESHAILDVARTQKIAYGSPQIKTYFEFKNHNMSNVHSITNSKTCDFLALTRSVVFKCLSAQGGNVMHAWMRMITDKCSTTKQKGDMFERLCKEYLLFHGYSAVMLLSEIPIDLRKQLGLRKQDFGIDIIAQDKAQRFHAVQAKYKSRDARGRKVFVPWRELSTFDALANRTGPRQTNLAEGEEQRGSPHSWHKHCVMTTANGVRRIGRRTDKDASICIVKFENLPMDFWLYVAQMNGNTLVEKEIKSEIPKDSGEEIRRKRLEFYDKS